MKKWLVLFHLTGILYAVDPPYFVADVEGFFIPDLINREKLVFVPGSLVDCKNTYTSPSYSTWECGLDTTEVQVTTGGKTLKFPLTRMYVYEYQDDPAQPSTVNYGLSGEYKETLPDGNELKTPVTFSFDRFGKEPNKLKGRLSLGIGVNAAIFAEAK